MRLNMANTQREKNTAEVEQQLQRVLASPAFQASERLRRFLEYSVAESLSGRADRIKAYTVATAVFGRGEDFDPQADAIVRIEAGRLRRAIEHYYLTDGRCDLIKISVPIGGYSAEFETVESTETTETPKPVKPAIHNARKSVLVAEFEIEGDHSVFPSFAHGFTRRLVVGLSRFHDLFVYGPEATEEFGTSHMNREFLDSHRIDFVATGSTHLRPDHFVVETTLLDAKSGKVVWGGTITREFQADRVVEYRDIVANEIARTLAQPYGVIFSQIAQEVSNTPRPRTSARKAVLEFYQYWRSFDPVHFVLAAEELVKVVENEPDNAEACACLSQIYTDSYRFGHAMPGAPVDPMNHAFQLARHAIELEPHSSRGYHALAVAYWFNRNATASLEAYKTGLSLNPNATELLTDYGLRLAMMAKPDEAIPLLKRSVQNNPVQPGTNRLGLALCYFLQDRFEEALAEVQQVGAPGVVYGYLLEAALLTNLGRLDEAKAIVLQVLKLDPNYGVTVLEDLEKRGLDVTIAEKLVVALRIAGMSAKQRSVLPVA